MTGAYSGKGIAFALFALLSLAAAAAAAPVANAGADQVAAVGQNVTVNGAASSCTGCSIVSYSWNFGDNSTASGVSSAHAYSSAAIYTLTLTIVANDSTVGSDTLTATVQSGDATPPTLTHSNVTGWPQNNSLPITATVTDNVGVSTVTLYYKSPSAGSYSSSTMSASGSTYSGTIPSGSTNESNVSYYMTATDTSSNSASYPSGGSSAPVVVPLSATDTVPPITALQSVSGDTSSPYWVTASNASTNVAVVVSGESGMLCRMGQSNSNYSSMTVGYVDCTISGSSANCTSQLGEGNYTRFVACKDSAGNEQNTSQTLNVTFGVDSAAPAAVTSMNATEGVGKAMLSWTPPADATSGLSLQKIHRSTGASFPSYSVIASVSASSSAYNDTTGVSGTAYYYRVVGQDAAGNIAGSGTASSAIVFGEPGITAISLSLSGGSLLLSATTSENASCRYSSSSAGYSSMTQNFTTGQNTTSHSSSAAGSSGTVTYYVSCADTAGNAMAGANSTSYTFAASTTTTTGSSANGGGSGGAGLSTGSSSRPSTDYVVDIGTANCTVSVARSLASGNNLSVLTTKLTNSGGSSCALTDFTFSDTIPSNFAAMNDINFTPAYSSREGWTALFTFPSFAPNESKTFSYAVSGWVLPSMVNNFTIVALSAKRQEAAPAKPEPPAEKPAPKQPSAQPAQQPPKQPAEKPAAPVAAEQPKQPSAFPTLILAIGILAAMALVAAAVYLLAVRGKKK